MTSQHETNLNAHNECQNNGGLGLLTLTTAQELEHLQCYIAVLGEDGLSYWLGYEFTDDNYTQAESRNGDGTLAVGTDNYGSQEPPGPGLPVCLTIRKDGMFYRAPCAEPWPYICLQTFQAPEVTNLTLSTSRFITSATTVTLTCEHSLGVTTIWRRNGDQVAQSEATDESVTTLMIDTSSGDAYGQYECVVSNNYGTAVSGVVELVDGAGTDVEAPMISSLTTAPDVHRLGSQLSLTCNFTSNVASVEWLINGLQVDPNDPNVDISTDSSQSLLVVEALEQGGVYQCRVFTGNGENSVKSAVIDALPGTPSPLDSITVVSDTRSSLFVQWLSPLTLNTYHPLLLRYSLNYYVDDESTSSSVGELLPVRSDGSVPQDGLYEYILNDLMPITSYVVTMTAESASDTPSGIQLEALGATFGNAPEEEVKGLTVQRTFDNKTVVARWDMLVTTPPTGQVEVYVVQYRNFDKEFINTVEVSAEFDYLVITPVEDANDYELRVRAGVRVSRDPEDFDYNEFTMWEPVKGITTKVPPTQGGLRDRPGEIVAIVVSVVCVIALITLVLVAGIICLVVRKREAGRPQRLPNSESESETKAVNMSALQDNEENMIEELDKQPF